MLAWIVLCVVVVAVGVGVVCVVGRRGRRVLARQPYTAKKAPFAYPPRPSLT